MRFISTVFCTAMLLTGGAQAHEQTHEEIVCPSLENSKLSDSAGGKEWVGRVKPVLEVQRIEIGPADTSDKQDFPMMTCFYSWDGNVIDVASLYSKLKGLKLKDCYVTHKGKRMHDVRLGVRCTNPGCKVFCTKK